MLKRKKIVNIGGFLKVVMIITSYLFIFIVETVRSEVFCENLVM